MAVPPAGPEVLSHVPREERLHFAVALLLETQSFPLRGVDLECRLQRLLAVNGSTRLAQELCMESTHYGVTLGYLDSTKLQLLLDEASDYAAAFWQRFRQRMRDAQYPGIPELASAFKRQARESGISHNLHLVDLRSTGKGDVVGALWAKTLKSLGMPQEELLQRLQMVAGQVHLRPSMGLHWALPLSAALLRLSGLPEAALGELRHQILSRHHSMSHVFDTRLNLAASMTNKSAMAKLLFEDFRSNFHQIMSDVDDDEEYERRLAALFAACDAHQDGAVDQEELQQALSVCAPPAGLSRLRTLAILQYGGWKAAWQSVGVTPEDLITVARFVALAANLDISYEDAWAIFSTLSPTGEAISYHQLVQHGGDFTLHEFALRAWLACEVGGKMEDVAKRLQSPMLDGDLNLQTFRQVCGVNANPGDSLGLDSSLGPSLGLTKGGLATKPRIPQLKCQPPLTEGEVEAAYGAFKAKYFSVTLGAIRSELTSNTAFSEVLALDRISASIGETMICRYRVPRELQSQLREHSFIALVPSNMYWTSGGGGSWMLGRQTVTEMTGPKFSLNRSGEGVVRLQVWPGVSQLDLGAADLRIFSSPDAMAIGKQVGGSARFQLRPPAPGRVMTESASLTPTSIRLLWEAPHAPMTSRGEREQHFRYVVRGKPMGLEIEQDTDSQERQMVWSHLKKKRTKFLTHEVNGLLPGVRYKFQVHAITDGRDGRDGRDGPARRRSLDERTPSASPVATPRDGGAASWAVASFGAVAPGATAPGLESLASPGVEVTMPQRPAPPQPSHAVLVDRGLGGSFTLRWAPHDGAKEDVKALDYEVFWTVPGEEAEADTAQLHADQEDQSCFGQRSAVWRYPLPVFLRKTAEGTVEGLLHPPEADGVADGKAVRFCVRAVDPITGSTSMMGDLGPPIQLPSAAEVILRNVDAVNQIGEGAVRAGGFKRFLEDAEDAGLIGGEGTEVDLRKQLYEKVESAGGLESMLEALADLQMKNFKEACEVVRSIQESTELTAEETPSWQHVVKLVAGAGGAKKFTRSFTTVELAEVLGNTQQLAALGIFEGKSEDHTLRDALLTNDEHMPQFFSKIQEELGGLTLDERQVADLSSALGIMARRSKGNWTELVDLIAGEGGPTPVQPLVKYSEGHVQELHSAMQLSSLDVEGLISFLKTAGEAEFIGQSADAKVREDFLTKLSAAGGASVLYSSLQGMDLKALRPAIMVARAANLHRESCLQVTAGSISRADAWHKLVEIIESKWGGPQAFLAASGELYESHRAIATERREESAFDGLVEQTGGRMAVTELLNLTASAGGVQHVLKALGPVQLSQVCNFLESLRRGGGRFQDLEKLSAMLGEAGGLTRLVKRIEAKVQDTSKLAEIIEGGATFERHGFLDLPDKEREKVPEVLAKVLAETTLTRFLKVFDAVRLSSLLELVPLLVSAGALRSKGQAQSEDEVAAAGKSILGWLSRAGGSFLVCSAVYQCEARMFLKFMEQANNMGLSQLRPASLSKVGAFLTELSRQRGSLEDFVAMIGETDLVQLVSTLNSWRFVPLQNSGSESLEDATESAPGSVEKVKTGEPFEPATGPATGPATPEEAQEVQDALEALRLVAHKSGIEGIQRLVQVSQKVECLERLEKGLELLESARLIRPWQSKGEIPDHWQLVAEFEPWNHLVSLVNSFGGPERFNQRVEAVNLQHFDECVEFLDAAGLTSASMKVDDGFSESIKAWTEVIRILVSSGGPALFLESLQGIVVDDFLKVVSLLRQAGLARRLEDEDVFPEMTKRLSFTYGYGESAGRIRNEMLLDFVQRVIQAGGFHAFWHALKGVDLMKLKGDLHCLVVIRQKLQELIAEDWWLAVHDAEGLEELLHSHLAERKRRADDLTLRQREGLVNRFKEIGGVEAFLDGFNNINLTQMLAQHKALHTARIKEVAVIEALAKIGQLVKNKVEHLNGLEAVAATLVRWGDRHYRGEEPVRLWKAMHQQVTWLLLAIEENGALLKATVNHSNHPGKEPELTPARLAQFLQALRPVGGVPGFLSAFRGLDFSTAAQQARILHDACVRSPETTKRLAYLYRLLRNSSTHLRGLEHFLRNFAAPVLAEAATQGSTAQDRLQVAERWQRLTAYLGQAAGKTPAGDEKYENSPRTASGADQVLEVLLLGLRLTEASGLKASKQDWDQLCHEIKCEPGLPGVLARLRGSKTSARHVQRRSAPASMATSTAPLSSSVGALLVRNFLPPCMEEGSDGYVAADAFASEPERRAPPRPSDVAPRRRPESAARARSSSVPEVLRTSPVPGWSPAESS